MSVVGTWPSTLPGPDDDNYEWSEEPRVRRTELGDGYVQRSVGGLNPRPRKMTLTWSNLSDADKQIMIAFVQGQAGVRAFSWTPPQEDDAIKVKATSWTVRRISGGPCWTVSVDFVEVFDA